MAEYILDELFRTSRLGQGTFRSGHGAVVVTSLPLRNGEIEVQARGRRNEAARQLIDRLDDDLTAAITGLQA